MGVLSMVLRAIFGQARHQSRRPTVARVQRRVVVHPAPREAPLPEIPDSLRLKGTCYVIDGDTIVIRKTKIRLAGIDAPEIDDPWGKKAKWAMVGICMGQVITARLTGERSHDRLVANCYLPDGRDIAAELVTQGLALDWACFSGGKYRHLEPSDARKRFWRMQRRQGAEFH